MDEPGGPTQWATVIEQYVYSLAAAGLSKTTRRLRRQQIAHLAADVGALGPWQVTSADLERHLATPDWKPNTRASVRAGLRSFYSWAARAGHVKRKHDPARSLPRVRPSAPNPRAVPDGAILAALAVASDREALMIRLAGDYGLRRSEIAQVHHDDVETDLLGQSLIVHGKGGKVRRLPLKPDLAAAVLEHQGYVFPGRDNGHLSPDWVGRLIKRMLPSGYTAHKLRHRFATVNYAQDKDVFAVQALLGHASPATTLAYVQLPADAGRRLIEATALG